LFGILAGLFFTFRGAAGPFAAYTAPPARPSRPPKRPSTSRPTRSGGSPATALFGSGTSQQLQRGYQVYKEVCAACHSLNQVAFRNLAELGYTEDEVKAEAASWTVPGIDPNTGEATTRPGLPTDKFPSPYANDIAARAANNNAIPPDLSLMTKARHDGSAYVYSLLTGYQEPPAELLAQFPDISPAGLYYNPYFANLNLAMAPPLTRRPGDLCRWHRGRPSTRCPRTSPRSSPGPPSRALAKRKQTGWPCWLPALRHHPGYGWPRSRSGPAPSRARIDDRQRYRRRDP
jgi:ubiquinol-cytochrome c reductase cytochrome c1 subunit